jgi:deoxyadenosine kinase
MSDSLFCPLSLFTMTAPNNTSNKSMDNESNNNNLFIGISGLIGSGKTTLATELGKTLNLPVYYEPVSNNEYLSDFYKDMARYGFPMQIYLLKKRLEQHQSIVWSNQGGVLDRTIYEDSVFAKTLYNDGHMDKRDYQTYLDMFQMVRNSMKNHNLIVHLDVTPEESLRRIMSRGRECESSIKLEYLKTLYDCYEEFLNQISKTIPVIRVDWSTFHDPKHVAACIVKKHKELKQIYTVQL